MICHGETSFAYGLFKNQQLVFFCIDAFVQNGLVGLVLVDKFQIAAQQPHKRVEKMHHGKQLTNHQIDGMHLFDVRVFVSHHNIFVFGKIFFRQYYFVEKGKRLNQVFYNG